ncbi:MAG: phospholipase [Candidatus Rokuibacteriota bacterium]|nr:MAG: phospholipase [Candidatus Rokubacteria bacterium]
MAKPDRSREPINRRQVLKGFASAGAALALGANRPETALAAAALDIQHVVLVMMENRSFDHFLGWVPGADGRQTGLSYPDHSGNLQPTYPLAPDFQGCGHADPDHSYEGGRVQYDGGACDGWLLAGSSDIYSIGYYTEADLPFHSGVVRNWMTCDGYYAAILSSTYPNRVYQHAAQTDRITNTLQISFLPTIWDRLAAAGLQGRYYYTDLPITALWGRKLLSISRRIDRFFDACATGTLPQVSFIDPKFLSESDGTSKDDHPFADIRYGQAFLNSIYNAVVNSPNWPNTVLIINYDEWGGFFDHVAPTAAPIPPADERAGNEDGLRGFRTPVFLISPWTPRGTVGHGLYDHTSVLRMIEWRWSLPPLTVRDSTANNLAELLDFSHANLDAPVFDVSSGPFGGACPPPASAAADWEGLRRLARRQGFWVP